MNISYERYNVYDLSWEETICGQLSVFSRSVLNAKKHNFPFGPSGSAPLDLFVVVPVKLRPATWSSIPTTGPEPTGPVTK